MRVPELGLPAGLPAEPRRDRREPPSLSTEGLGQAKVSPVEAVEDQANDYPGDVASGVEEFALCAVVSLPLGEPRDHRLFPLRPLGLVAAEVALESVTCDFEGRRRVRSDAGELHEVFGMEDVECLAGLVRRDASLGGDGRDCCALGPG